MTSEEAESVIDRRFPSQPIAPLVLPDSATYVNGRVYYRRVIYRVVTNGRTFVAQKRHAWWPIWSKLGLPHSEEGRAWLEIQYWISACSALAGPWRQVK